MRLLATVIYTDKLNEVRAFWQNHFYFETDTHEPNSFGVLLTPEGEIIYVDSGSAQMEPSRGIVFRLSVSYPIIERARLVAAGVACSEMIIEDWGAFYGSQVGYFTVNDPSGAKIQFFEDRYGEVKQLMTTGDGTGTRKIQERELGKG